MVFFFKTNNGVILRSPDVVLRKSDDGVWFQSYLGSLQTLSMSL